MHEASKLVSQPFKGRSWPKKDEDGRLASYLASDRSLDEAPFPFAKLCHS
jgi:hypothetical protein